MTHGATLVKITFIEPDGIERQVDALVGDTLMTAAVNNGVRGILADCGGACTCATCHIYIDPNWIAAVGSPDEAEREMLDLAIEPQQNSRLSCQIIVTAALDGLIARTPASQF